MKEVKKNTSKEAIDPFIGGNLQNLDHPTKENAIRKLLLKPDMEYRDQLVEIALGYPSTKKALNINDNDTGEIMLDQNLSRLDVTADPSRVGLAELVGHMSEKAFGRSESSPMKRGMTEKFMEHDAKSVGIQSKRGSRSMQKSAGRHVYVNSKVSIAYQEIQNQQIQKNLQRQRKYELEQQLKRQVEYDESKPTIQHSKKDANFPLA